MRDWRDRLGFGAALLASSVMFIGGWWVLLGSSMKPDPERAHRCRPLTGAECSAMCAPMKVTSFAPMQSRCQEWPAPCECGGTP